MLSRHRQLNMYKMTTDFGHISKYDILDMFLRYKDKNALYEGYHGILSWKCSYTTFGYSLYGVLLQC